MTILEILGGRELSVGQLADQLNTSQPHTSNQLALLRASGLVRTRRAHRHVYYRVAYERVSTIIVRSCARALVRSLAADGAFSRRGHDE